MMDAGLMLFSGCANAATNPHNAHYYCYLRVGEARAGLEKGSYERYLIPGIQSKASGISGAHRSLILVQAPLLSQYTHSHVSMNIARPTCLICADH